MTNLDRIREAGRQAARDGRPRVPPFQECWILMQHVESEWLAGYDEAKEGPIPADQITITIGKPSREAENWPNLTHQNRERLHALCKSVGVVMDDKWLSDAAIEAIEKLSIPAGDLMAVGGGAEDVPDVPHHVFAHRVTLDVMARPTKGPTP